MSAAKSWRWWRVMKGVCFTTIINQRFELPSRIVHRSARINRTGVAFSNLLFARRSLVFIDLTKPVIVVTIKEPSSLKKKKKEARK